MPEAAGEGLGGGIVAPGKAEDSGVVAQRQAGRDDEIQQGQHRLARGQYGTQADVAEAACAGDSVAERQ